MPKRVLTGTVVCATSDKTVTVVVSRLEKHPVLGKVLRKYKKFAAHDQHNTFKKGDVVRIEECRPLSRTKTWKVQQKNS